MNDIWARRENGVWKFHSVRARWRQEIETSGREEATDR